ncbi:MAG: hypothetical protein WBV76_14980, partial [Pseudolabrys sp.]
AEDCGGLLPAPRRCVCCFAAIVRTRCRTAQVERNLAVVYTLLVAGLAAEPLLAGAGRPRLELPRFTFLARGFARWGQPELRNEHHRRYSAQG